MRLTGFAFAGGRDPLDEGYMELSDLTVVIGPNDAGKSSLLRHLQAHLAAADPRSPSDRAPAGQAAFYLRLSEAELEVVAQFALSDLLGPHPRRGADGGPEEKQGSGSGRSFWRLGGWNPTDIDGRELDPTASFLDGYIGLLADLGLTQPGAPASEAVLSALRRSALVALVVQRSSSEGHSWGLNVYWCLPSFPELSQGLQDELRESDLKSPSTKASVRDQGILVAAMERADPTRHLRMPSAPVAVAPLGSVALPLLPRPVSVPVSLDLLKQEVVRVAGPAIEHLVWGVHDRIAEAEDDQPSPERHPVDFWLDGDGTGGRWVHEATDEVLAYLTRAGSQFLPAFISTRYSMAVFAADVMTWREGQPAVLLSVSNRHSEAMFDVNAAADGHRLWFQLALLEALAQLRAWAPVWNLFADNYVRSDLIADELEEEADSWTEDHRESYDELSAKATSARENADEHKAGYDSLLAPVRNQNEPISRDRTMDLTQSLGSRTRTLGAAHDHLDFVLASMGQGRLYFIDEPEQHLHPRLQREAARWLESTLQEGDSQAVIATHSPAFMRARPGVAMTYLARPVDAPAAMKPFRSEDLQALSEIALDLGLDRGELLTMKSVFLFVEGRNDQVVMETLWSGELAEYGIAVVPIHSSSKLKGIIDAEVLLRFSSAPAAAWLDRVSRHVAERLKADPDTADDIANDKKQFSDEERHLAQLMRTASEHDRVVEPLPHPGQDIFDLLHDEAIIACFPTFPGHSAANEAFDKASERRDGLRRKDFYADAYDIEDRESTFRAIATEMRVRDLRPAAMQEVITRCANLGGEPD